MQNNGCNDLILISQVEKQIYRESGMSKVTDWDSSITGISDFNIYTTFKYLRMRKLQYVAFKKQSHFHLSKDVCA